MKRTTYILISMLIAGMMVIVAGIVFLAVTGEDVVRDAVSLDGERAEMELDNVSVVKAFVKGEADKEKRVTINGEMTVTTSATTGKGKFSYPKSKYLKVSQKDDTLFVEIDITELDTSQKYKNSFWVYMDACDLRLSANSTLTGIVTSLDNVKLKLNGMRADSMFVYASHQEVSLDSCQFRSLDVSGDGLELRALNSKIENYYLNLDNVRNWTFENTIVGTEYLSGGGRHSKEFLKGECRRVIWNPSEKNAELSVIFQDKAEITVTQ